MKIPTKFTPQAAALPPVAKRPYATPSVKEFGMIRAMTGGGTGLNAEGGSGMAGMM